MDRQFVSRGGIKLQAALDTFAVNVQDKVVLDVGSSTGGFVDCLLQNGASKVYAVDTSYGELAWKLRNDPRVKVLERTNILHLESLPSDLATDGVNRSKEPLRASSTRSRSFARKEARLAQAEGNRVKVDLVTIDAGWTKLDKVLPVVKEFLTEEGVIIALLKPQYEADKNLLRKGVVPEELVGEIKDQAVETLKDLGFSVDQVIESPILGGGGNKEYLLLITV